MCTNDRDGKSAQNINRNKTFGGPRVVLNWTFFKQNLCESLACRRRGSGGTAPVNMLLTWSDSCMHLMFSLAN